MLVPGSIGSAFARPSLATIVVIPSRVVQSRELRMGDMRRVDVRMHGVCVSVEKVEGWEKVRIVVECEEGWVCEWRGKGAMRRTRV